MPRRLIAAWWMSTKQATAKPGVGRTILARWRLAGQIEGRICSDRGEWLYGPLDALLPESKISNANAAPAENDNPTARGAT